MTMVSGRQWEPHEAWQPLGPGRNGVERIGTDRHGVIEACACGWHRPGPSEESALIDLYQSLYGSTDGSSSKDSSEEELTAFAEALLPGVASISSNSMDVD